MSIGTNTGFLYNSRWLDLAITLVRSAIATMAISSDID